MPKGILKVMFLGLKRRHSAISALIFEVLVRCQGIIVSRSHPDGQTKIKETGPKHARKHCRQRVCTYAGQGPWGGYARDQKEEKGDKERSQLESLKGKVEILENFTGSHTLEGQRPGELLQTRVIIKTHMLRNQACAFESCCFGIESCPKRWQQFLEFPKAGRKRLPVVDIL